jgi:predicted nucleotide-binding protein
MSRKPAAPANQQIALGLTEPREEAARRLQARIEAGNELQSRHVSSVNEYYKEAVKWSDYNETLLKNMFTTDAVYQEYISEYSGVFADNEGQMYILRRETTDAQIARLESIKEKLELYPELKAAPATRQVDAASHREISKVFVVHGHDCGAREEVARFLEKIKLRPVILQEQPDKGQTIIEKFESHAGQVGFAVVVLTPDDIVGSVSAPEQAASALQQAARARQNVIFELGYFTGKLGRGRACLLRKGHVEIPSDLYGVIYTEMDTAGGWKTKLAREMKAANLNFDVNDILL